jgi:hypothetical protein
MHIGLVGLGLDQFDQSDGVNHNKRVLQAIKPTLGKAEALTSSAEIRQLSTGSKIFHYRTPIILLE